MYTRIINLIYIIHIKQTSWIIYNLSFNRGTLSYMVINYPFPFFIVVMITVGYLCSAISCVAPLFSPSVEHHKIVNYFIASLGIIVIAKHIIKAYK